MLQGSSPRSSSRKNFRWLSTPNKNGPAVFDNNQSEDETKLLCGWRHKCWVWAVVLLIMWRRSLQAIWRNVRQGGLRIASTEVVEGARTRSVSRRAE
jgi:hypothetical protein